MEYYIGLALSTSSNVETGLAVINQDNQIILVDKLFSVQDIQHFFDNFSSLKQSNICVSLPWDNSMLNGKWRILSKPYQMVASSTEIPNTNNWTQRFSPRSSEYFSSLKEQGVNINRFELYLTRQSLKLNSCYKERSPADCKFLQNVLKLEHGFEEIPSNMMPVAQLEAIVGAMMARDAKQNPENVKVLFDFNGIDVINKM